MDYFGNGTDYDMHGFYNKYAHFTNFWNAADIDVSSNNDMQSDIVYEDTNQLFHVVYLDSTDHTLKYATQGLNILAPGNWPLVQSGMNDDHLITLNAMPRIAFRPGPNEVALVWTDEGPVGRGVAKFDVQSFVYAGVNELGHEFEAVLYPNPVKHELFIELDDALAQLPTQLLITDLNGRVVRNVTISGQTNSSVLVDEFATGTYLLKLTNAKGFASRLFVKE